MKYMTRGSYFVVFIILYVKEKITFVKENRKLYVHITDFYVHLQNCEKQLLAMSCLPIHASTWNSSILVGHIFMNFDIEHFLKIFQENSNLSKI
jgi:hypothetical protein